MLLESEGPPSKDKLSFQGQSFCQEEDVLLMESEGPPSKDKLLRGSDRSSTVNSCLPAMVGASRRRPCLLGGRLIPCTGGAHHRLDTRSGLSCQTWVVQTEVWPSGPFSMNAPTGDDLICKRVRGWPVALFLLPRSYSSFLIHTTPSTFLLFLPYSYPSFHNLSLIVGLESAPTA